MTAETLAITNILPHPPALFAGKEKLSEAMHIFYLK